jgi:acyl carrier protein/NADP-dependent 3-hydroxy acid dehydrogenase YdfG
VVFATTLTHPALSYLWQHAVNGRSLVPGAAMFEAAHAAATAGLAAAGALEGRLALAAAAIKAPLLLGAAAQPCPVQCVVRPLQGRVELISPAAAHLTASIACATSPPPRRQPAVTAASRALLPPGLGGAPRGEWHGRATSELARSAARPWDGYAAHPALLDAATHHGALFDLHRGGAPRVPVALGGYLPAAQLDAGVAADAKGAFGTAGEATLRADGIRSSTFALVAGSGPATLLDSLSSKALRSGGAASAVGSVASYAAACWVYQTAWQVAGPPAGPIASSLPRARFALGAPGGGLVATPALQPVKSLQQAAVGTFGGACAVLQSLPTSTAAAAVVVEIADSSCIPCTGPVRSLDVANSGVTGLLAVASLEEPRWKLEMQRQTLCGLQLQARLLPSLGQPAIVTTRQENHFSSTGVALITGGFSGLGQLAAEWMVGGAAPGLTLLGRNGRFAAASAGLALKTSAALVHMAQCNLGSAAEVQMAAQEMQRGAAPLDTVVHAAGVLADRMLPGQTLQGASAVFAPKVAGLTNLLGGGALQPLRSLQLFSSISALLGNPGQANYAAANALLDSAAVGLQHSGLGATSVQWGPWAQAGMAVQSRQLLARLERQGLGAVQPAQGLAVLAATLSASGAAQGVPTLAASPLCWANIARGQPHQAGIYDEFVAAPAAAPAVQSSAAVVPEVSTAAAAVEARVLSVIALVVGAAVELRQPLMEAGLDSLGAVDLRNSLAEAFGVELPATVTFDYPTPADLATLIASQVAPASGAPRPSAVLAPTAAAARRPLWQLRGARSAPLAEAAPAAAASEIVAAVVAVVAQVLGAEVDISQPFMEVRAHNAWAPLMPRLRSGASLG